MNKYKSKIFIIIYIMGMIFTNGYFQNNYTCSDKSVSTDECNKIIVLGSIPVSTIWPIFWAIKLSPYLAPPYK